MEFQVGNISGFPKELRILLTKKDLTQLGHLNLPSKFILLLCLATDKQLCYLDSSFSEHMTRDKSKFMSLKTKEGGFVTYGDNNKARILGVGNIGNFLTFSIENVLYVEGLKHNLLSISQLCDKVFKIVFN